MEDNREDIMQRLKKFLQEVKDFAVKHISYTEVEDAEKASLADDGPLASICNKYIANGTLDKAERRFRAYYEDTSELLHAELEVSYLSKAYGYWNNITITL